MKNLIALIFSAQGFAPCADKVFVSKMNTEGDANMMNKQEQDLLQKAKEALNVDHAPVNDQAQKDLSNIFSQDQVTVEI